MVVTGTPKLLRELNARLIIDTIREAGNLSRAEVARQLGLSAPTVSLIIEQLLSKGILQETGTGDSSGGRRPILLALNPNYRYVAGVDLGKQEIGIALGNLNGDLIGETTLTFTHGEAGESVINRVAGAIKDLCRAKSIDSQLLAAIALAVPGVYDPATGLVKMVARSFDWEGLRPEKAFQAHFTAPVIVKNDVNTAALGEFWRGQGRGINNLAYISVGLGIGAGIILNGQLLEGCRGAAGEIGFMALGAEALQATYRQYGHLETIASTAAVVEQARRVVTTGKPGLLLGLCRGEISRLDFRLVCQAASLGDEDARELLERMAGWVGLAVANLQQVLDVELIVVGGEVLAAGEIFLTKLRETVSAIISQSPQILFSSLQEKTGLFGTFAVALDYVYDNLF
ncbi:ROK family transcriptional regulator [Moorella sp. Hama-1]|uniref:ROK family transcriptional regulator n=1 Tax=Moorella sp. Hama-1 TaxID=2138101 RepID=UPI000D649A02|nr:ROK family transcriptional regulator [Moorella sp. Hama-1]BCV22898.1 transcriptional regulator [Moorella sp. Hama-1]